MEAEVSLLAEARTDPSLGSKFVEAFVEVRQPLPGGICDVELVRAYGYRRFGAPDPEVEAAYGLEQDSNRRKRTIVRCMLLRPEYGYGYIGRRAGLSESSVRIYQMLFWPVRDRGEIFILSLVYPRSRQCELEPGYAQNETEENLAYRLALRHGIEAVEYFLGSKDTFMKKYDSTNEMSDDLARRFLSNAHYLLDLGFINQDLPGLKHGLAVVRMLNSGRHRRREIPPTRYASGVSAAVAVSQCLGKHLEAPNEWSSCASCTGAHASKNGSSETMENMSTLPGEEGPLGKTKKTSSPSPDEQKVEIARLDKAA